MSSSTSERALWRAGGWEDGLKKRVCVCVEAQGGGLWFVAGCE